MRLLPFCACGSFMQQAAIGVVCMQATTMHRCLHVHIYSTYAILPSNRCWARTQGAAGRPPPYNGTLMHDSAQTHTHTYTTHQSVKHVVLQTAPATWDRAALCSLYKKHGSKRVCTIVCCTSLFLCEPRYFKREPENHRGCVAATRRKLSGTSPDGQH